MNENRNQNRHPKQQAATQHPEEWRRDLNPNHLAGQNIGVLSDEKTRGDRTAFNVRKQGWVVGDLDDNELQQIPVVAAGTRLQQGATYIDLKAEPLHEFTATGDMAVGKEDAFAPKDRVPYEIWNRLLGEEKPGQRGPRL
jgi:hypothetical protein